MTKVTGGSMQESKASKSSNSTAAAASTSTATTSSATSASSSGLSNAAGDQEKGFALLRLDTIQLWTWLEGYQPLDDLSLKSLSEDISYRIRETTDNAINYMHHCKRSELKTGDLNKAFQMSNIDKIYGLTGKSPINLRKIQVEKSNEKVLSQLKASLFEFKDETLPLKLYGDEDEKAAEKQLLMGLDEPSYDEIHGRWLLVNGNKLKKEPVQKSCGLNLESNPSGGFDSSNFEFDIESELFLSHLSPDYKQYYDMITSIILGEYEFDGESEDVVFLTLLEDLKTNPRLQPMLPFLINFFSRTIQSLTVSLSSEKNTVKKKIYIQYLERCIETLRHLILNRDLFLAPKGIYSKILSCLLFCILQNSFISHHDSFVLKETSSFVLVTFLRIYKRFSMNTIKYITEKFFLPRLNGSFGNEQNLLSVYGILACFTFLGGPVINQYYSKLKSLAQKLEKINLNSVEKQTDINVLVTKQLIKCLVSHFIWYVKHHESLSKATTQQNNSSRPIDQDVHTSTAKIVSLYKLLAELYGTSFIHPVGHLMKTSNSSQLLNQTSLRSDPVRVRLRTVNRASGNALANKNDTIELNEAFERNDENRPHRSSSKRGSIRINYGTRLEVKRKMPTSVSHDNVVKKEEKTFESNQNLEQSNSVVTLGKHFTRRQQQRICENLDMSSVFI